MPLSGDAKPRPKAAQLARGQRRYRRKVASPKQWQAIIAAKQGPCRVCRDPGSNGSMHATIQFHHLVSRARGGDDVGDNIVPLCETCHGLVTRGNLGTVQKLVKTLTREEATYLNQRAR